MENILNISKYKLGGHICLNTKDAGECYLPYNYDKQLLADFLYDIHEKYKEKYSFYMYKEGHYFYDVTKDKMLSWLSKMNTLQLRFRYHQISNVSEIKIIVQDLNAPYSVDWLNENICINIIRDTHYMNSILKDIYLFLEDLYKKQFENS